MAKYKFFTGKHIADWILTAVLVGLVGVVLNWMITAINSISTTFAGVVTGIALFVLLGVATKMHPGKEDFIGLSKFGRCYNC